MCSSEQRGSHGTRLESLDRFKYVARSEAGAARQPADSDQPMKQHCKTSEPLEGNAEASTKVATEMQQQPQRLLKQSLREPQSSSTSAIPPILQPGLLIVFVGFNPGLLSGQTGHHYAHPSNRFWRFLHESGLTQNQLDPSMDRELPQLYQYGFTDLVARPTTGINQLSKLERQQGARMLEQRITANKPEFVVFIGKGIWETISQVKSWSLKSFQFGLQPSRLFGGARPVVLPSTSGLVSMKKTQQMMWWKELATMVENERERGEYHQSDREESSYVTNCGPCPKPDCDKTSKVADHTPNADLADSQTHRAADAALKQTTSLIKKRPFEDNPSMIRKCKRLNSPQ